MWLGHLFAHLVQLLSGYAEERSMDKHDRMVAKLRQRRKFAHFDVPPIENVEAQHGKYLNELIEILVDSDPAGLHTRKSRKGAEPKHVDMMRRRYRLMAWTLIHRLTPPDAIGKVELVLSKEHALWFGGAGLENDEVKQEELVATLTNWRKRWDFT